MPKAHVLYSFVGEVQHIKEPLPLVEEYSTTINQKNYYIPPAKTNSDSCNVDYNVCPACQINLTRMIFLEIFSGFLF